MSEINCSTCCHVFNQLAHTCGECNKSYGFVKWEPRKKEKPPYTMNDYQQDTARTDNHKNQKEALTNFAFGICGEAGEIVDLVKKVIFHGHPIDKEKFKYELGDQFWYLARTAEWVGLTLEEVAQANIDKLMKRYPTGFNSTDSINREE